MSTRKYMAKGFTLVEILIVVVILGILAAIVIPQFSNASEEAQKSSMLSQLQTLRSQIELYQLQHNGEYPGDDGGTFDADKFWTDLTGKTDVDGTTNASGQFGPYILREMSNPFTPAEANQTVVATAAAATAGWVYDMSDGTITICLSSTQADNLFLDEADGDITEY